jgi:type 1 fimbriae regulatory protein FimB/type 1 fimbriae regulatory protein FimE
MIYHENMKEFKRLPNLEYRSREYLTPKEVRSLLKAAQNYGRNRVRNYALVLLMFRHGLRLSEAINLRWDAISFADREIFVQRLKGSDSSVHPLVDDEIEALEELRALEDDDVYVFIGERGQRLTSASVQRLITRLGKNAKLTVKVHPHQLRHACGYFLINKGESTRAVQDFLGHRNIMHTERYTKYNANRFRNIDWSFEE